jgi:hypothetical protein
MFHDFLFHTLIMDGKVQRVTSPNVAKLLRGEATDPLPNFGRDVATILRVIGDLCDEKITDAQVRALCQLPAAPDANPRPDFTFGGVLAHKIVNFVNQTLKAFPLIKLTPLLQRGVAHPQPFDTVLQKGILLSSCFCHVFSSCISLFLSLSHFTLYFFYKERH